MGTQPRSTALLQMTATSSTSKEYQQEENRPNRFPMVQSQLYFFSMVFYVLHLTGLQICLTRVSDSFWLMQDMTCGLEMSEGILMDFVMSNILCIQMNFGLLGKLVIFPFLKQHWHEEVLDFSFNCSRLRRTNKLPYSFHWTSKKDFPVQT